MLVARRSINQPGARTKSVYRSLVAVDSRATRNN
jgi:hypothetical protein